MTLVKLSGGRIFDPANKRRGEVADLYIRDGRISAAPVAESALAAPMIWLVSE